MAKSPEQDKQDRHDTEARMRGEADARAKARAEQPEPGSAAARTYGSPATTVGESQPHQPPPREPTPAPRAEFPKWKYSKDEAGVVVETKEAEEKFGEGWQDRPVPFGPEDTKGMKVTDEALKKYTDAVYPKGWRDDQKRTDKDAIEAAKASREVRGIKDGAEGDSKREEFARKEEERVEKDAEEREELEQQIDKADRERLEREQQERQQQRDREREQTKARA